MSDLSAPLARAAGIQPPSRPIAPDAAGSPPAAALTRLPADIDWRDIPVFIVNRNRCAALQRLVAWLLAGGTRRVVILDNASTYGPLLDYYAALPDGAKLMRLDQNFGPYVFWQQGVHKVIDTLYVLTDSDVVPADCCPADLIARLLAVLQRYPDVTKAGPALRIDNLPDAYVEADTVRKWESQFWEHPVAPGLFAAPIDTTFALYRPHAEFSNDARSLRLGHPCIAEHTPWYAEEHALSDEERYYRQHTSAEFSNWSVEKKESWVQKSERVSHFERRAQVLHLDCGREYIAGWLNVVSAEVPDAKRELEFDPARASTQRLAIPNDSVDGFHISDALGEVRDMHSLMNELWRVAKPSAKLHVRLPYGCGSDPKQDSYGRRSFGESSFAFFAQPVLSEGAAVGYSADWQLEHVRVLTRASDSDGNEAAELVVSLTAIKPSRPRAAQRAATLTLAFTDDGRIDPLFDTAIAKPFSTVMVKVPKQRTAIVLPMVRPKAASSERVYIYTGNHDNAVGIGDMVRFLKLSLQACGHEVRLTHEIALGATNVVLEGFLEPAHLAPLINAKAAGTRFIFIGTEPIAHNAFNGGLDAKHWHYGNTDYWTNRFKNFLLAAPLADAVWVLAESMVQSYADALPGVKIAFLPYGHVEGYAMFENRPPLEQDIDFYFSGTMTSIRAELLQTLARSYRVVYTNHGFGDYLRHDYIARAKVCLSLRLSEANTIPSVSRMHFHLQHKNFLLHEAYPLACSLDRYVLHAPRAEFSEWAAEAVRSDRRQRIADSAYERFREEAPMKRLMQPLLDAVFSLR